MHGRLGCTRGGLLSRVAQLKNLKCHMQEPWFNIEEEWSEATGHQPVHHVR